MIRITALALIPSAIQATGITRSDFDEQVTSLLAGHGGTYPCGATKSCDGEGGSCTPYPFQPHTKAYYLGEPDWMDDGKFTTYAFVPYDVNSYQAYSADNADDTWIVHGHDGAGIQATDCGGDVHYFEHIGPAGKGSCDMWAAYPGQDPLNACYFHHPGKDEDFQNYNCGWWRGYEADADNNWSGLYWSWDDMGVDAQGTSSTKDTAMDWLRNCYDLNSNVIDCSVNTMNKVQKDGQEPVAYFVGTAFPWICTETSENTIEWTGVQNSKCYCDNEPWGGRNVGSTEPNHNMEIVYCGKYDSDYGMWCDYIKLHPEYSGAAIESHFWMGESSF